MNKFEQFQYRVGRAGRGYPGPMSGGGGGTVTGLLDTWIEFWAKGLISKNY